MSVFCCAALRQASNQCTVNLLCTHLLAFARATHVLASVKDLQCVLLSLFIQDAYLCVGSSATFSRGLFHPSLSAQLFFPDN